MSLTEPVAGYGTAADNISEDGADVGLKIQLQIGLVREQITLPSADFQLTLPALREICCSFVDRKVSEY